MTLTEIYDQLTAGQLIRSIEFEKGGKADFPEGIAVAVEGDQSDAKAWICIRHAHEEDVWFLTVAFNANYTPRKDGYAGLQSIEVPISSITSITYL